jgi:hypothetical protein
VDQEEEVVVVGAAVEDVAVEDVEVVVAKTCKTSPVVFDGVVVTVSCNANVRNLHSFLFYFFRFDFSTINDHNTRQNRTA